MRAIVALIVLLFVFSAVIIGVDSVSATPTAQSGPIGIGNLTAKVIAYPGEIITGQINATGYNFGVFIGPGVTNVLVYHAHIYGASDHGIYAEDTSGISIMYSNISYDVLHPDKAIPEDKALQFSGVSNSYIVGNIVTHAAGDGGIRVSSSSSLVPSGLPIPEVNASADNNFIADNYVANDSFGCGITVTAWGPGQIVANNWVFSNTVIGSFMTPHGPTGFAVGTIVVAADFPFSVARDNVVLDNTVIGGLESNILVNAQAPWALDIGNQIIGNTLISGGFQRINNPPFDNASNLNLPPAPNGIGIYANYQPGMPAPPMIQQTNVVGNIIINQGIGIWNANAYNGTFVDNYFENVTINYQSFYGIG